VNGEGDAGRGVGGEGDDLAQPAMPTQR
jgi:hypothetical protein